MIGYHAGCILGADPKVIHTTMGTNAAFHNSEVPSLEPPLEGVKFRV